MAASLRIVAGSLKGRRIATPDWEGLRPTSDKLRETLFNVLAGRVEGAHVLDGFAGTGALGIEALSRGASSVTFVESDLRAQALIVENLARVGVTEGYTVLRADVGSALEQMAADAARVPFDPFDIVLFDPPYSHGSSPRAAREAGGVPALLSRAAAVVARTGVIVLEHSRRQPAPPVAGGVVRIRELHSGNSTLSFYERA
jgi:16S rRNA (guanine(966)-N(2))-methyltransferase RsmD